METVLGFVLVIDTCPGLVIFDVVPHLCLEIFCPLVMLCLEDWVVHTECFEVPGLFLVVAMQHGDKTFPDGCSVIWSMSMRRNDSCRVALVTAHLLLPVVVQAEAGLETFTSRISDDRCSVICYENPHERRQCHICDVRIFSTLDVRHCTVRSG